MLPDSCILELAFLLRKACKQREKSIWQTACLVLKIIPMQPPGYREYQPS